MFEKENETISRIISSEFAEIPANISPLIAKGFVNQVFLVVTSSSKFIIRLNNVSSLDEYKKEKWASDQAIEKLIPTPQILTIGIFDHQAYSVQKYVDGTEGRNLTAGKRFIWKKFGEYANRIHSIKICGFGLNFCNMTEGNSEDLWLKYLDYNIESLNKGDELLNLDVLTHTQLNAIRKIFENLKFRNFRFGLNHGDLSLKNSIVDESGTIHLIDWGSAEASIVPHHDLIQLLRVKMQENNPDDSDFAAFLEGYGMSANDYRQMLPDLKALSLLRAFDKLWWAIDRKIKGLNDYVSLAKATVEEYLQ